MPEYDGWRDQRDLERSERSERMTENWRRGDWIGANRMKLAGCDPSPHWAPNGWVWLKLCVRCDTVMEEFDIPVWEESLRNRWCDKCIKEHIGKLWWQKRKLEIYGNEQPKEGVE